MRPRLPDNRFPPFCPGVRNPSKRSGPKSFTTFTHGTPGESGTWDATRPGSNLIPMKSSRLQGEQIGFFFLVCPAEMAERKLDAVSSNFPGHREAATCTDLALSQKLSLFLHRHEQSVVRRETGHSFVQFFAINIPTPSRGFRRLPRSASLDQRFVVPVHPWQGHARRETPSRCGNSSTQRQMIFCAGRFRKRVSLRGGRG